MCALRKRAGGLRPIAVGSVYRRLPSRIAAQHASNLLAAQLKPVQLGVGVTGGCEAAVHAAREYINWHRESESTSEVLVKIDMNNAFNCIRRDVFLAAIRSRVPEIYPFARFAYHAPTPLFYGDHEISSSSGIQQGDPLGPLAFALGVDSCARSVNCPLNVWYLDDATIAGPADLVARELTNLIRKLEDIGLTLNEQKCEVAYLGNPASDASTSALNQVASVLPNIRKVALGDLELLGAPLADAGVEPAVARANQTAELFCGRLKFLDPHIALFFLSQHISTPKLTYLLRTTPTYKALNSLKHLDETIRKAASLATNVDLGGDSWSKASLPVRYGGLGLRRASLLAYPCYIASLISTGASF